MMQSMTGQGLRKQSKARARAHDTGQGKGRTRARHKAGQGYKKTGTQSNTGAIGGTIDKKLVPSARVLLKLSLIHI